MTDAQWSSTPTADRGAVAPPGHPGGPTHGGTPTFDPSVGGCLQGKDPVDLATGEHIYIPCPDVNVYNPHGPSLSYQRNFLSKVAKDGYHSPGQSVGWVDTYDIRITANSPGTWGSLKLIYPNSATETLTPVVNGVPTGQFTGPLGAEYAVTGVPSGTTGQWDSISITFKGQTVWTITPTTSNNYALTRITDRVGHWVSIDRDPSNSYRVTSVSDDATPSNTLLSFSYDANGYLQSIIDAYQRKVLYTYGSSANTTCLLAVSQIGQSSAATIPMRWSYGYTAYGSPAEPRITSVGFPSATGSGTSTEQIQYDSTTAQVSAVVDANGNQACFSYCYTDGTRVTVKTAGGATNETYIANFDPAHGNIGTGTTDAKGADVCLIYGDANNPDKPTKIVDQMGHQTILTYDRFGNILTSNDPRGTITTYWYNYPDSEGLNDEYPDAQYPTDYPLGRLMKVQQGTKTPTTFSYYEPSGLVHTVTTPRPGGGGTVTKTYTYDDLGSVLTVTTPGNPTDQTTTFNYTQDGTYTQPAKMRQPLTLTDNLGHVTHYRYDDRGNTIWTIDAIGNRTDFTYNLADQLVTTINPSVSGP